MHVLLYSIAGICKLFINISNNIVGIPFVLRKFEKFSFHLKKYEPFKIIQYNFSLINFKYIHIEIIISNFHIISYRTLPPIRLPHLAKPCDASFLIRRPALRSDSLEVGSWVNSVLFSTFFHIRGATKGAPSRAIAFCGRFHHQRDSSVGALCEPTARRYEEVITVHESLLSFLSRGACVWF